MITLDILTPADKRAYRGPLTSAAYDQFLAARVTRMSNEQIGDYLRRIAFEPFSACAATRRALLAEAALRLMFESHKLDIQDPTYAK